MRTICTSGGYARTLAAEPEIFRQASAFYGWYGKQGGDMEQVFQVWCDSKDLGQEDRDRIWLALHGSLDLWRARLRLPNSPAEAPVSTELLRSA